MFKVRAYESRATAEGGRATPAYASSSGDHATATKVAIDLAKHYGAAVVENSDTGHRDWHEADLHLTLRKAKAINASDAYFKEHTTHDNDAGRMLFERGFARGFDSARRFYVKNP